MDAADVVAAVVNVYLTLTHHHDGACNAGDTCGAFEKVTADAAAAVAALFVKHLPPVLF
jgi:hypothetical protein